MRPAWLDKSRGVFAAGLFVLAAFVLAALLYRTESVVVPAWTVRVVDLNGKAVEGLKVVQVWQDYSVESRGHEEAKVTGEDGIASFPERKVTASVLMRNLGPAINFIAAPFHASSGPSSWIIVWGKDDLRGSAMYIVGKPLPAQITVKPTPQ